MPRASLVALCLLAALACSPRPALVGTAGASSDAASWGPADVALANASAAMSQLSSMRELLSTRTYRNDELFLGLDIERAYVAPDRRYERIEGRSAVDVVKGETVSVGPSFFKRDGEDGAWKALPVMELFAWPANEYTFPGVKDVAWGGAEQIDGRGARLLVLNHDGVAEQRNQGWRFVTRLWIDAETSLFLKRETHGQREEPAPDPATGKKLVQNYEGGWSYLNHNASIVIGEPPVAADAS